MTMPIPLTDYKRIFSRPGRKRAGGDEGFAISADDEAILNEAWSEVADEDGVAQLPNQPLLEEIAGYRT